MKLAIISDIHEDIVSLRQAFGKIEKMQCDEVICLGDLSGFSVPYYPYLQTRNAHECLAIIRANCKIIIAGNHDLNACRRIPRISPLFNYPNNWFELDYHEKLELSGAELWMYEENELDPLYSKVDLEFLSSLPEYEIMHVADRKLFFSHYLYPNITGSTKTMYHSSKEAVRHLAYIEENDCSLAVAGHEHPSRGLIYTREGMEYFRVRKKALQDKTACVLIPAIASGPNRNGFCIFDLNKSTLEIKRI